MKTYLDTHFLLRLFLDYEESETAFRQTGALRTAQDAYPVTWLHRIEFANALELMVFQSRSGVKPHVTPETAGMAQADFDAALRAGDGLQDTGMSAAELIRQSRELIERHTAKHGFRTHDLIHVSSALLLKCTAFGSFDAKARRLARLAGLKIL